MAQTPLPSLEAYQTDEHNAYYPLPSGPGAGTIMLGSTRPAKLSARAQSLMELFFLFETDCIIPESILTNKEIKKIEYPEYQFLLNQYEFCAVRAELYERQIIRLDYQGNIVVSIENHNNFWIDKLDRVFSLAVQLLDKSFPNYLDKKDDKSIYDSPKDHEAVLPHIKRMMRCSTSPSICPNKIAGKTVEGPVKSDTLVTWIELLLRAGSYARDSQHPHLALPFIDHIFRAKEISHLPEERVLGLRGEANRLQGHVYLDLAQPRVALTYYMRALKIYEAKNGAHSPVVAEVLCSLASAYSDIGDIDQAFAHIKRGKEFYEPVKLFEAWTIQAVIQLRAGQADEALESLHQCWMLQGKNEGVIKHSSKPEHGGDQLLLSRIYWSQGNYEEAQKLASQSITTRHTHFEEKGGPRVADSRFTVAMMLNARGFYELSASLLWQIIRAGENDIPRSASHVARAYWFLAEVERHIEAVPAKFSSLRASARMFRSLITPKEWPDEDTDEGYMRLVRWMLL